MANINAQIIKGLNKAQVFGDAEIDKCLTWALGEDYGSVPFTDWAGRWNRRHEDIFRVLGSHKIEDTCFKIGQAYIKQKGGQ